MNDQQCFILGSVLGKDLTGDECALFKDLGEIRELKDGDILIEEGKVDNRLHLVVDGNLAVSRKTGGEEWVILHVLRRGELAGELGFIDGEPHSATLRAVGPARVFSLERDHFESLLESKPLLVYRVMRAILRGVHNTLRRMNVQQMEMTNYITRQHGRY
ncbi:MAG: cyclic nucleotide-binding domain-containing protein [Betaproteobacteria bacterium]|jgi:CRP-like cAMP-binding protein|nr:MAG: cyclic nucleotide-binding protein [bacterium]KAF0147917.1 MAG: cyclic nucleotide-binding protein [bacterium]KAF0168099.1 MAG: cyclic nucleotide-binding protein [bacterium]MBM4181101.1 cyclic nucleotide-binding domain-containing protein [Betaproteobacteria bacterium]TXT22558.1 MAG: cyclic nucleotide-binding protein [bacterium]